MSHQRAPRWRRRPLLAVCARSAAWLLPLVVSGLAAVLVLDAFTGWPPAWRIVWWTCVVVGGTVAALVFVPVAHRLSALGLLLGLEVEFPSPPPSRVRLAVGTSTIMSAQFELARTARADSADELLTARLATASLLGVLRTMEVRKRRPCAPVQHRRRRSGFADREWYDGGADHTRWCEREWERQQPRPARRRR